MERQKVEQALVRLEQLRAIRLNKVGGDYYQMYCPFHNNGQERKPSFGVLLNDQVRDGKVTEAGYAHCFSCQYAANMGKFVRDVCRDHNLSPEMYEELKAVTDANYYSNKDSLIPDGLMTNILNSYAVENLKMRTKAKQTYVTEEELAKYRFTVPYMYQRKLTDAVIEKYDIGFDGNFIPPGRKKPMPCVTFPVHDIQGRTLFVCRRSIEGKFFHIPEGVEKSVFGLYELPPGTKEVIICESVFNALTCVVYGHPAVALFGTGTTHEIEQLRKLGVSSYIICLDNDEAGNRGAEKLKKALKNNAMVWKMTMPEGRDVNDVDYETFMQCYNARE